MTVKVGHLNSDKNEKNEDQSFCSRRDLEWHEKQKRQSEKYLEIALLEKMETQPLETIHVTDLCRQAEIGRKTFYRHYSRVEEVLEKYFDGLVQEYLDTLIKHSSLEIDRFCFETICREFFSFWNQYSEVLKTIQKSAGYGWLSALILERGFRVVAVRSRRNPEVIQWFPVFTTGGFCALLEKWTARNFQPELEIFTAQVIREWQNMTAQVRQPDRKRTDSGENRFDHSCIKTDDEWSGVEAGESFCLEQKKRTG